MEIPRHWRLKKERYSLIGLACPDCDNKIFPPRPVCPNCHGETIIHPNRNQAGVLFNATEVISLPTEVSNSSK